jgi:hypothetical protein
VVSLTAVDLLKMVQNELDELFRASPAGPIPTEKATEQQSLRPTLQ